MTVRVVERFDGKRLEACDHVGTLKLDENTATCQECGCVWDTSVAWGSFGIHQRIVADEGTSCSPFGTQSGTSLAPESDDPKSTVRKPEADQ